MIERYTTGWMKSHWSEREKLRRWLRIEKEVIRARVRLSLFPEEALKAIESLEIDEDLIRRSKELEEKFGHDLLAFVSAVNERIGVYSSYFHRGLTSSDVVDTALAIGLRDAILKLEDGLKESLEALKELSIRYKNTICAGRTHGIHAEPTTFGLKVLGHYAELLRALERLKRAREVISFGKLSGAVGTYSSIEPKVEEIALRELGLKVEPVSTQVVPRDRHLEVLFAIACTGVGIERFATEVRHLQRTEVGEVFEPFGKTQRGSSAMPHKRNPVLCERLCGLSRLLRSYVMVGFENVVLWHERDISHSSAERVALIDATILLDYMLEVFTKIVKGLEVREDRMMENINLSKGAILSSKALVILTQEGIGREEAYEIVQKASFEALKKGEDFLSVLLSKELPQSAIEKLKTLEYSQMLKNIGKIFDRVLGDEK
ncbi:MAG: adenylosuccinate lyase [Aquificaceae bacterium]